MSAVFSNIATSASPAASPASREDSSAASATVSPAASSAASAIAAPKRIHQQLWRADQLGNTTVAAHPSRFPELDSQLPGGGWPLGMLTELIARNPGVGELRLLIPMLRQLTLERKVVIMLAPPLIPYAPALASFGIDLNYLIIIQAPNAADRLWAVEQTLKSTSFGALLAWLPQDRTRPEHLRRMQLAAQSSRGPVFLFRELPAQFESSPAPLRLLLLPRPEQQLAVQLLKRRGPLLADPVLIRLPQPPLALKLRMGQPSRAEPVQRQPMQGIHARMEPTSVPS
jgi:protein ImuA